MRKKDIATDIENFITKNYTDAQRVYCSSDLNLQFNILSLYDFKVDESSLEEVCTNVWSFKGSCMAVMVDRPKTKPTNVSCIICGNAQMDTYKNQISIPESGDDMLPATCHVDMDIHVDLTFLDTE